MLKAIIFDVDGTLAETERDGHRVAFNRAFAESGLDWEWDIPLYGELLQVTGGKERMLHFAEGYRNLQPDADLQERIRTLHWRKTEIFTEMMRSGIIPFRPGVLRLIREAKGAGLLLAIATTTTEENLTALFASPLADGVGLDWFDVVGAGDVVPKKKPDPGIYLYALERLRIDPSEAVAIEDSGNGLRASTGAGIRTVITVNDYTQGEDYTEAELVLSSMGEPGQGARVLGGRERGRFSKLQFLDLPALRSLID
jgi:HAD superfamily hydrolase (TIGR01509 family)